MTQKLIIDTDCGVDDAIALLMALTDPSAEVIGITCVSGNVPLHHVVRNVGIVLDAIGAGPIPIFQGAARPILASPYHADDVHGSDGLGDAGFPATDRKPETEHAALALIRLARENPGATLVALGPLTNVALALAIEPALPQLLGKTVIMGGAVHGVGNTSAVAEFNIYADPEGAAIAFDRGINPTMLTWEGTLAQPVTWDIWDRMIASGPIGQRFINPMTEQVINRARERERPGILLPDPLAMAAVLDQSCATTYSGAVTVDTGGSTARGMTTLDRRTIQRQPDNARVVSAIDHAKFVAMLERMCVAPCHL